MKRFKDYITEEEHVHLSVDSKVWLSQRDKINHDLETITETPFLNSALFQNSVRGTLERYGILLPAQAQMQFLSTEGEIVYTLVDDLASSQQDYKLTGQNENEGNSSYYLYMVWNLTPEANVEGYANIVTQEELDALGTLDHATDPVGTEDPMDVWRRQQRHTNDDSGNDDEYV